MKTQTVYDEVKNRIDTIEESYEFMLAYAGQGVPDDRQSKVGGQLRDLLGRFASAAERLEGLVRALVDDQPEEARAELAAFADIVARDAAATRTALRLALAQPAISSQLIDNLNAMIHVRALLTDLFFLDELLKRRA